MTKQKFVILTLVAIAALLLMLAGMVAQTGAATPTPTVQYDPEVVRFQNNLIPVSVTFVQTSTLSGAVEMHGLGLMAIDMPASWVTANLSMQAASTCSGTFDNVYKSDATGTDTEYQIGVAASEYVLVAPADFAGMGCMRFRSGTAATPVTQTTSITLTLMMRPF